MARSRAEEAEGKVALVRAMARTKEASATVLTRIANFAWLSCGGRSFINIAAEGGAAAIVVTAGRVAVVTTNIEADRLREEELTGLDWEVLPFDWWDDAGRAARLREVAGDGPLLADGGVPDAVDVGAELVALRSTLTPEEQLRAAALGRETGLALEACCRATRAGDTEFEAAGRLAAECYARGIEPVVHLVAADERAYRRRHPLPTARPIQRYAMVVACGLRDGLVVSATRLVHFGPPPDELVRRWRAAAQVDAEMIAATRPGATAGQVFASARAAYARAGFPDEWRFHHQGGLAGYASREWRAVPDGGQAVAPGQIFAWNPSVAGAKSEDTVLSEAGGGVPRVLTDTGHWPVEEVRAAGGTLIRRPRILTLA